MEIAPAAILERQKLRCYNRSMRNELRQPTYLTNEQLLSDVKALAGREREATARLIASLAELDARRLYLGEGYSSLFTYCTRCLHLSEHAAYGRIEAARVARRLPAILDLLADGSVTLTTVCLLAPHLTPENHRQLLDAARHKCKRDVEQQVAALRPLPPVAPVIRKLPAPGHIAQRHSQDYLLLTRRRRSTGMTTLSERPTRRAPYRVPPSSRRLRRSATRCSSP